MIRAILVAFLAVLLTACGGDNAPSQALVEKAIVMQVSQTQQELSQQLFRQPTELPAAKIDRVKIKTKRRLTIEDLTGYQIRGTYNLTLELPKQRATQRGNPFEVYLQRQVEDKTWRLARPQLAEGHWVTQRITE